MAAMMPPVLVVVAFLVAVLVVGVMMAYLTWRGSKPSDFFQEAVRDRYDLTLPEDEIAAYFELKDRTQAKYAPETMQVDEEAEADTEDGWISKVPGEEQSELKRALMRRLVGCIDKLDQVQKDKPGHWKLWRAKLVSERFWSSLCEAEQLVSQEVDSCIAEAAELQSEWKDHIFPQAVQCWRMQKQHNMEKKAAKKAVVHEKKQKEKEVKRKVVEKKLEEEDKQRQERLAEKMMEKLLREEEAQSAKAKGKSRDAAPKSKGKKK